MKHTILLLTIFISSVAMAQENAKAQKININQLAPHLPVIKSTDLSKDELTILGGQLEDWKEEYYQEYDTLRTQIISMLLDGNVEFFTIVGGIEMDATPIYRLKGWELDHGLSEEEWQPIWERIQIYRAQNSEE